MVRAINIDEAITHLGFVVVEQVIDEERVARLIAALNEAGNGGEGVRGGGRSVYALRHLLEIVPAVRELSRSRAVRALVERVLGVACFAVRSLLFDKTPAANWKVAWHQDLSIAVRERVEVEGFGAWSEKAGVTHVQPPAKILEKILTLRLHLDPCGEANAPLRVIPGSHLGGRLDAAEIRAWRERQAVATCLVPSGGALLMRPLLLHASSAARSPQHRRVVHLEFAADDLPGGLQWFSQRGGEDTREGSLSIERDGS